jgi:hypothetical protein
MVSHLQAALSNQTESVHATFAQLDRRLRRVIEAFREQLVAQAQDPYHGLYVSEAEVDALLGDAAGDDDQPPDDAPSPALPRLDRLVALFALDPFERDVLLLLLAPELDARYERLYGYLQDDVSRRRPTVDLTLRLLGTNGEEPAAQRWKLGPSGRLFAAGLVGLAEDGAERLPLLSRPLRLDERVAEYLVGSDHLDPRVASYAELVPPRAQPDLGVPFALETIEGFGRLLEIAREGDAPSVVDSYVTSTDPLSADPARADPLVYLHGATGAARRVVTIAAAARTGWTTLIVDLPELLAAPRAAQLLTLVAREALLQSAVLVVDGFDRLQGEDPEVAAVRAAARALLSKHPGPIALLGESHWEPATWLRGRAALRVELPMIPLSARVELWRRRLDGVLPAEELTELAARFRLDEAQLRAVEGSARLRASWRGDDEIAPGDVRVAARAIATPSLEGLARRIEPRYDWDDIVLTVDGLAQLRELCARARHAVTVLDRWGFGRKHARRAGLTALFAGPPGTGKTMAAEIIAANLSLALYRIDLSSVVSKYIGETEKNLERIFRAADRGDAVLLFDEADALFGKRSETRDAHDRYANVEIAYLLQRLETYDGVAVLTTNLRGNLDEAFVRRIDFALEFPLPEEAERLKIWRLALPDQAPLAEDVDLPFLARKFRLSGGHIRNITLTAAFLAADDAGVIGMKHLVRATRREYQKIGKLVAESDFERYYPLLKDT